VAAIYFSAQSQPSGIEMRIFTIRYSRASDIRDVVEGFLSAAGKVSSEDNTNKLIVMDYPANIAQIENLIDQLDARKDNVEIQVKVCEVSSSFLNELGLSGAQVIISPAQFSGVLSALGRESNSNIKTQMTVRTLSGSPANLGISKDQIYGQVITHHHAGHDHITTSEPLRYRTGSFLEALPTAHSDGTITVDIRPSISRFDQGAPYEQTVLTKVNVNSGDTIMIGGVESSSQTTTGGIFSRQSQSSSGSIVMFLTATVVK